MIKVSVIIPTVNRKERLFRSVNSVLSQQLENFEIIIVDDYKMDQTNEIKKIFNDIPQVRVIKSWRHAPSGARNLGVHYSKGEYITFLDDDDIYLPGRINNMLSYIEKCNEKISFVSSGRFYEVDDFKNIFNCGKQKFGRITINDVLDNNGIDIGFLMCRDFFMKIGGFDEQLRSLEDWDLIIRSLLIFDGYKLERMDYAVNAELNRERVSLSQEISRKELAEKYQFKFGKKWYYDNKIIGEFESNKLNYIDLIKSFFYSKSLLPFKIAIKYFLRHGTRRNV